MRVTHRGPGGGGKTGREGVEKLDLGDGRNLPPRAASDPHGERVAAHDRRAEASEAAVHVGVRVGRHGQCMRKRIALFHHDLRGGPRRRALKDQDRPQSAPHVLAPAAEDSSVPHAARADLVPDAPMCWVKVDAVRAGKRLDAAIGGLVLCARPVADAVPTALRHAAWRARCTRPPGRPPYGAAPLRWCSECRGPAQTRVGGGRRWQAAPLFGGRCTWRAAGSAPRARPLCVRRRAGRRGHGRGVGLRTAPARHWCCRA